MRLIIVRHGETKENHLQIIQGQLPGKLSKLGILQAKKLALRLKSEQIDCVYSSDLARAVDTTNEILKYHEDLPVHFSPKLREQNFGSWQGKSRQELGLSDSKFVDWGFPSDGESLDDLFNRANEFFLDLLKNHSKDSVLIVAHGGLNRALIAAITKKSAKEISSIGHQTNTGVCEFEIDDQNNVKSYSFNCIKHLE